MRDPRTVLITGASSGIGAALARHYAAPGRRLILQGRDEARLREVGLACEGTGAAVETRSLELTDTRALREWLGSLADVDLAIVNAGVSSGGRARESWEAIEQVLEVNVRAAIATVTALVPAMRARGRGQIALMSSLSAWHGLASVPAYSASKAALKAYGEALGGWLAREGIEVSVVMPGFVDTPMTARFRGPVPFLVSAEDAAARVARGLAAGRARIAFPLALDLGLRCLALLPEGLARRILRALGFR